MATKSVHARPNPSLARRALERSDPFAHLPKEITEALGQLEADNIRLTEALGSVQMMIDAQGWKPAFEHAEDGGLNLASIKVASAQLRELVVGNPFVKQGSHLRNVGIWGEGVEFSVTTTRGKISTLPPGIRDAMKKPANLAYLFSADAQEELERAAYTDGTIFLLFDSNAQTFQRVPLAEIVADWRNPNNSEEVWLYRRQWLKDITGPREGSNLMTRWYYTDRFTGRRQKTVTYSGNREQVSEAQVMVVKTFNRQTGWAYGVPDALPVIAWAKLYKEFLVNGYIMSRALAQIAYKATAPSNQARQSAAAEIVKPGQAGSTATLAAGADLVPLQTAGKGYDFESGKPLAAAIASGVQVSLGELLSDPANGDSESLDRIAVATAAMRRRSWEEFWVRIFTLLGLKSDLRITWHDIRGEQIQRVIQAWELLRVSGQFAPEVTRDGMAGAMGIADPGDIPEGYLQPNNEKSIPKAPAAADAPVDQDDPNQGRMPSAGSGQGKDAPAGGLGNDHSTDEN